MGLFIAGGSVFWIHSGIKEGHVFKVLFGYSVMYCMAGLFLFNQFVE